MSAFSLIIKPDELVSTAIMSNRPILVVEGINDYPIYSELYPTCDVYIAENLNFEDSITEEGCSKVVESIKIIRENINNNEVELSKYILGIIDLDTRIFTSREIDDPIIYTLDKYSIENYFVNSKTIKFLVKKSTRLPEKDIPDDLLDDIFDEVKQSILEQLFLIVIDSIQHSIDKEHFNSLTGFKPDRAEQYYKNSNLMSKLEEKKESLFNFCRTYSIEYSWESLHKLTKGKWLLHSFLSYLCLFLQRGELKERCYNNQIVQCQSCKVRNFDKCLYSIVQSRLDVVNNMNDVIKNIDLIDLPDELNSKIRNLLQ